MKKLFENPSINSMELSGEDVIMTSALAKQNSGLGAVTDESDTKTEIWKGTEEAWI